MSIAKNIKWYEERLKITERALDKACEQLSTATLCQLCNYKNKRCCNIFCVGERTLDCSQPEYWKAMILKEVQEDETEQQ